MSVYYEQCMRKLCDPSAQKQAENAYISLFRGLSLRQYAEARRSDCQNRHTQPCANCSALLLVASSVLDCGYCLLSEAFKLAFPQQTYNTQLALARFLQMPLASLRVGTPSSGKSAWYLVEYVEGVNYVNVAQFAEAMFATKEPSRGVGIDKSEIKALLGLAQSDCERELIRYSVFKTLGLTPTSARKQFGFERMKERSECVQECIQEARNIREAIDKLAAVQDDALLMSMGFSALSTSESEADLEDDTAVSIPLNPSATSTPVVTVPSFNTLHEALKNGRYNWCVVADFLERELPDCDIQIHLNEFYEKVSDLPLSAANKELLATSYSAYRMSQPSPEESRTASILNGDIVTDSESDDAADYAELHSLTSDRAHRIVSKRRRALSHRSRRLKAKMIVDSNFLARKRSKCVQSVVTKFPDIGQSIESYVSESNIGADAWRRTGVLTFDGNLKVKQKVTYGRIQQYLQEKYQHKFSYGTVVQLCVARNKRRRSASNYKGIAKVTTRRARKGFELKYNPDRHWSGALYKSLNFIQYTDGSDITNVNRDDASGFRLDTLTTHGKHATPSVVGQNVLTTHTDYVNKHPSVLQVTSYNFTATATTSEMCAGVVKASKVYQKNPAQHFADFEMLSSQPEFHSVFNNATTGCPKRIECIRVDGATDEGPSHDEVRFWWTVRHFKYKKVVTLISSRSSGSSYLNRVELQNGC